MNMTKETLMSSNYWVLNKNMVKELGLECAFILTNLAEADNMMADSEGWFYQTSDTLEKITGFKKDKQTKILRKLIKLGLLLQKNKGIPQKRYFKIDYNAVESIVYSKTANYTTENEQFKILETSNNKESTNKESKIKKQTLVHSKLDDSFNEFWNLYNKKTGRKKCLSKWKLLKVKDRENIMKFLPRYIGSTPDIKFRQNPYTFLNGETWNDDYDTCGGQNKDFGIKLGQNGKPFEKPKTKCIVGFDKRGNAIYEK